MKSDIHPEYRPVVFQDQSSGTNFLVRSTINTPDTIEYEGQTYPLAKLEISSASHPFFTGQMKIVDTAGRVERFERRYGRSRKEGDDAAGETAAATPAPEAAAPAPVEAAPEAAATSEEE